MKKIIRKILPLKTRLMIHHIIKFKYLLKKKGANKFVIFGTGRSGSTLLTSLLNSHPEIYCDSEVLSKDAVPKLFLPGLYLEAISRKAKIRKKNIYGCGIMTYQLQAHNINPFEFIRKLYKTGWKIILIRRLNVFKIVVSILKAQSDGMWEVKNTHDKGRIMDKIYIEPEKFKHYLRIIREQHEYEDKILHEIPHFSVIYENHLDNKDWQLISNELFNYLGLENAEVESSLLKNHHTH